jgi:hypothetical protein
LSTLAVLRSTRTQRHARRHFLWRALNKGEEPMELLPVELRKTLPPLYSQESCPNPIVHVKLFTPDLSFTWYVTEGAEHFAAHQK